MCPARPALGYATAPTKKLCSCGADLSSLSVVSRQKTLDWVESLEGTGSEWAAGAYVHQEDACDAAPMRRAEIEAARGPRGDREAVLTA